MKYGILIFLLLSPLFASNSAVVFMYHRFGVSKHPSTNITIEQFKYQLDYLQTNEYNVWTLSKIITHIKNKKPIPPKTVAITIDDAYKSIFSVAYPMLKEKNYPFTVFVNTNPIDNRSKNYMTWEQMRIMQKNGAEFANHSLSHPYLLPQEGEVDEAWQKRVRQEILKAQQRLEEELHVEKKAELKLFSYPFGEYTIATARIVKELGFIGVTQLSGPVGYDSNLSAITRFAMSEMFATPEGFKTKLNTIPLPVESLSKREPFLEGANPPKLRIRLKEPISAIGCYTSNGDRISIEWISSREFEIVAGKRLSPRRDRYTCTAPAQEGKWYWYSHLWIIK